MRKYHTTLDEPQAREGRRGPLGRLLAPAAALAFAPLAYEWGLVIYARWGALTGAYREPRTPILDALGAWLRDAGSEARWGASRVLETGPWSPSLAVPLAVTWAAGMAVLFLRKTR